MSSPFTTSDDTEIGSKLKFKFPKLVILRYNLNWLLSSTTAPAVMGPFLTHTVILTGSGTWLPTGAVDRKQGDQQKVAPQPRAGTAGAND